MQRQVHPDGYVRANFPAEGLTGGLDGWTLGLFVVSHFDVRYGTQPDILRKRA